MGIYLDFTSYVSSNGYIGFDFILGGAVIFLIGEVLYINKRLEKNAKVYDKS